MADPSPAALKVRDAILSTEGFIDLSSEKAAEKGINQLRLASGIAALRSAIKEATYRDAWHDRFLSAERILAIADELEKMPS